MNKKIVGFVLATCLTLGLGAVNLFASNYDSSSAYVSANNNIHSRTIKDSSGTTTGTVTSNGFLIKTGSAGDRLSGNLSGVFSYFAGTMIGYQQAGGNYVIYDSYGARATLSNAGGNKFTLQNFNFRPSDLANMPGENATIDDWNNYMKSLGFTDESLRMIDYGEDGYPKGWKRTNYTCKKADATECKENEYNNQKSGYYYFKTSTTTSSGEEETKYFKVEKTKATQQGDVDTTGSKSHGTGLNNGVWSFTDVEEGVNEYKSMNLVFFQVLREHLAKGINYSASVSIGDGVSGLNLTLAEDGKQRATYTSYDGPTDVMKGAVIDGKTYPGLRCTSEILYNNDGMQYGSKSYTFEFNSTDANSKNQQLGLNGEWKTSVTYINFDSNGVRYDTTFNNCTIDPDMSKSTFVDPKDKSEKKQVNLEANKASKTKATSVTYYTANGSYFSQVDNTTGNITYFADNKQSYVLNSSGTVIAKYQYTANGVLEAMWQADNTSDDEDTSKERGGVTTVYDYWGREAGKFQENYNHLTFFGSHEKAQAGLELINSYKQNVLQNGSFYDLSGAYSKLNDIVWYEEDIVDGMKNSNFKNMINQKNSLFSTVDVQNMLRFSNGVSAVAETSIANSDWGEGEAPEDAIKSPNLKKTTLTDEHVSTYLKSSKGITFTTKIKAGGADIYEKKCNVITEQTYMDPVVNGTFEGLYYDKKTGKTYAKVSASEINIMDGSGFQAADGETILVEIDEETAKSLKNMKKGDKIMFMGDVTKDVNGYMTMKMNKDYSGGIATGSQINKLREDIQNEKLDWVKENTAVNTAIFGNNGATVDWKAGWNVLTGRNKAEDLKRKFREDGGVYLAF